MKDIKVNQGCTSFLNEIICVVERSQWYRKRWKLGGKANHSHMLVYL